MTEEKKEGNPGTEFVPMLLCAESRAHMETKIDNMERNIRWSVYLTSAVLGAVIILVQLYLLGGA